MSAVMLVAFHRYLRPAKALRLKFSRVTWGNGVATLLLPLTQSGQRGGCAETVVVEDGLTLKWLGRASLSRERHDPVFQGNATAHRMLGRWGIEQLGLDGARLLPLIMG
jgi:hypothetical protein